MREQIMLFVNDYAGILPPSSPIAPVPPILLTQPVGGQCDVFAFVPDMTLR